MRAGRAAPKAWRCKVCGFVYRSEEGLPESGIPPGTAWEDVPSDWKCPDCGSPKHEFHMVEIDEAALAY